MISWAITLLSWMAPLAKRVLIALGIGTISYVGIDAVMTGVISAITSSLGGLSSDIINILAMGGFTTAISIILGGVAARISMMTLKKLGSVL
jgi:hypothetical protein